MTTIQWREYRVTINPYPQYLEQQHAEGIDPSGKRSIWLDEAIINQIQREGNDACA